MLTLILILLAAVLLVLAVAVFRGLSNIDTILKVVDTTPSGSQSRAKG